jgi:regulatory protein
MKNKDLDTARAVAFRFLAGSARSRTEIQRRLEKDEIEAPIIETVIAQLEAEGLLNDAQFARDWVADRADRKRYGRRRLAAELQRKGIDRELQDEALGTIDDDSEMRRAREALQAGRFQVAAAGDAAGCQAEQRRISGFLQRRGFGWNIIAQVLREQAQNRK